ncbi:hypothetical protein BUE93_20730 [Chromobacterium amazonense]|uniref:Uncharacterized protein n=1 Tax=Chromobacterium amazonense TaxID=1382803 RepID=A0A2S9WZ08_9NEIS|nr:hypothetical protein [Chromobacterium amazonense]PRP68694.1 hypothetical protein BUE93_20730 [Chromobacterium amazonense]
MSFLDNMLPSFTAGGDPFATRVAVGSFEFQGLEVPESITIGAKQQTVVHKLTGGKRIVDVLGVDYDSIGWKGWMLGPTAGERVKALEALRDAGEAVVFVLEDYHFKVVISHFAVEFSHRYRRQYTIELEVIDRADAKPAGNALSGSLDALINSDVGSALGLANVINVQAVTDAVTSVQSAVSSVQSIANATAATVQTVIRPIVAAGQVVNAVIGQVGGAIQDITTLGGLIPGNPVSKAANNHIRQVQAYTQLPALYELQSVLGRIEKHVLAGPLASGTASVVTSNTNLQSLAAQAYGDQSQWTRIAAANGMTDPKVAGVQTVVIPKGT